MSADLSSILDQLKIETLSELYAYEARTLAKRLDEAQLDSLNTTLKEHLWQTEILPTRMKEIYQLQLPLEILGLEEQLHSELKAKEVNTLTAFIRQDTTDYLTSQWTKRDRLAVRFRIFCLLMLPTEQLAKLKESTPETYLTPAEIKQETIPSIPVEKTPIEPVDPLELDITLYRPWLEAQMPDDFSLSLPQIEKFLFADIYQLPITTSRRHEIWAGTQMKAAERLQKIIEQRGSSAPQNIFRDVYARLWDDWQRLEQWCLDRQLRLPNCSIWSNEILMIRQNFYQTPRSRFRHFIRKIENSAVNDEVKQTIQNVAFDIFEMLCLLPDTALRFVREQGRQLNGSCPTREDFSRWLTDSDLSSQDLVRLCQQGRKARNELTAGYIRAVLKFARKYVENTTLDYLDLAQEGVIGLILAADKYEYRFSGRFITYATAWLWQTTERAIADYARNIRIPVHRQKQFGQLEKAYQACLAKGFDPPSAERLALHMDFLEAQEIDRIEHALSEGTRLSPGIQRRWEKALKKTKELLIYIEPTYSLESEIPAHLVETELGQDVTGEPYRLMDVIYDPASFRSEEATIRSDVKNFVTQLCQTLSGRNQKIIELRFGLQDGEERTLAEIGQMFGLTRERIRQIEANVIGNFKRAGLEAIFAAYAPPVALEPPPWPRPLIDYINNHYGYWAAFTSFEPSTTQDWQWLDALIAKLPGSDWHTRSGRTSTRREQTQEALEILGVPAYYSDITEQLNDMLGNEELEDSYIYALLARYTDIFILLGEGVFSLTKWEKARGKEVEPILPYCPALLPDLPGQKDTFFESVLVAHEYLKESSRTSDFLQHMLKWVGEDNATGWFKQSILNAYYLVGLIPYTFHFEGKDPILNSTLPSLEFQAIRRYCLQRLTNRLVMMPEFWWIVRQYEPGRTTDFANHFVEFHPLELDDVFNRLKLLTGLGAMRCLSYGRYQLTSLGVSLAADWAAQPDFTALEEEEESTEEMYDLSVLDLGLW